MTKKPIFLLTALALACGAASAAEYYVVVPVKNRQSPIAVSMQANALPAGYVNEAYTSTDFKPFALVTGDSNYDSSQLALILKSGTLPTGMSFVNGVLSGTPTQAKTNEPLQVEAAYKTKTGAQTYGLTINPGRLVAKLNADFYKLPVGYTAARYAYVKNNSASDVSGVGNTTVTSGPFSVDSSLANECATLSGGILKAGQSCAVPLLFTPTSASTAPPSTLRVQTAAGQVALDLTGEGIPLASTSTIAMSSPYQTNNSLNWSTFWRFEALVDKARNVVTYNAYFTSSCTSCNPPIGNYIAWFYAPSPLPSSFYNRKITGYVSNLRLSSSAPLTAGNYRIYADGLSMNFTVSPTYQITASSLTYSGAAVTSVPITVTNN